MARRSRRTSGPAQQAGQRRRHRAANRTNATRVLATGVGAAPKKAFGCSIGHTLACWDAKHPHHLPLPRAVGPYTVIRATKRVQINSAANVIGTFQVSDGSHREGEWAHLCMISDVAAGAAISGTNNTQATSLPLTSLGAAVTMVPSALSVQIMCPTALQTASGIVYAGVMNTQAKIAGRTDTWTDYMDKFVQFQSPRLLAASKLALRGVQINSYPLNMTEVSKFEKTNYTGGGVFTLSENTYQPAGWAPIIIYNPDGATLELLITVEYRVRFDLDNPASASHAHHPVAPDSTWDKLVRQASALGHGVMDIADVVANTGMAIGRAMAVADRVAGAGRSMLALT